MSPDVVIHLAGISDVDYCEVPSHWEEVRRVNFNGAVNVIRACDDRKIPVVYISSEHVFPGRRFPLMGPYLEQEAVGRVGLNNYALVKIACEGLRFAFPMMKIVRTSYLFDWMRLRGKELDLSRHLVYYYPTFIHRSYIYLPHFVSNLLLYVNNIAAMPSILHLAGSKTTSQYRFMKDFVDYFHIQDVLIYPRRKEWPSGEGQPLMAHRPHRVGLDVQLSRKFGFPLYDYKAGFEQMDKDVVRG